MSDAIRTMLLASAQADVTQADDPQALLAQVQAKIRAGIEPTDDEMRAVILAARAGRRNAAIGQARKRASAPPISTDTLFKRQGT